jgi:hypothetical protein
MCITRGQPWRADFRRFTRPDVSAQCHHKSISRTDNVLDRSGPIKGSRQDEFETGSIILRGVGWFASSRLFFFDRPCSGSKDVVLSSEKKKEDSMPPRGPKGLIRWSLFHRLTLNPIIYNASPINARWHRLLLLLLPHCTALRCAAMQCRKERLNIAGATQRAGDDGSLGDHYLPR